MVRRSLLLVTVVAALLSTGSAAAQPGMFVGARDDGLKWRTATTAAVARDLGLGAMGITLGWQPGQTDLTAIDALALNGAIVGAGGMRVVVAVFGDAPQAPIDARWAEQYCAYVGRLITRFPQLNDIVIWNEPNLSAYWRPQYRSDGSSEAPVSYTELLARCYDVLHGIRDSINVIAPATSLHGNDNPNALLNSSHSPTAFIREMGVTYRRSGRTRPLFDTLGHHPYPARSDERPWAAHPQESIVSIGDLDRLVRVLDEAFDGTAQPQPDNGLPIWYLETGYQTQIDSEKAGLYTGVETWPGSLPDRVPSQGPPATPPDLSPAPDQATQLADSLRLTYCQPYVSAVFNFLIRDEKDLRGWQSGLMWTDGSRKDSYVPYREVVREVNEGRVSCGELLAVLGPSLAGVSGHKDPNGKQSPTVKQSLTKVTFRGRSAAPYGFLRLGAQLTRGLQQSEHGLGAKQLLLTVGPNAYVLTTDATGGAGLTPMPPLNPGRHKVQIDFRGDMLNLGSGLRRDVLVTNSRGRVQSDGVIRLGSALSGRLDARSNGVKVSGTMTFRHRGKVRSARFVSLGLREDRRAAWLRGLSGPDRYVVNIERLRGKRLVRVRVWRNGSPLGTSVTVPAAKLRMSSGTTR
jgi:hypothetical protein